MHIHAYGWLVTVPLTIAMIQLALAPREHAIKRFWWSLREVEAEAWFRLGRGYEDPQVSGVFRICYVAVIAIFAVLSIASFCEFLGVMPQWT